MTMRLPTVLLFAGTALSTPGVLCSASAKTATTQPAATTIDRNGAETVRVGIAGHRAADGVTGLQPGGGLIKVQTAPKSVSAVSNDYIQKQAPSSSPFMLVQLLPGAVVSEVDPRV